MNQQTLEKLTDEIIAIIIISTNDMCKRMELLDYVIRRMYQIKNSYATNKTGSTESVEGSGTLKEWPM